jgi:hypothetical protein
MTNIIQGMWIGEELSPLETMSIASFLKFGYEYHLYVYDHVRGVPEGVVLHDAHEILPREYLESFTLRDRVGGRSRFSHWFRYELLWNRGGWWADCDVVCLKRLEFDSPAVIASFRVKRKRVFATPMVMKLPPRHPVLNICRRVCETIPRQEREKGASGPALFDRIVRDYGFLPLVRPFEEFAPLDHWDFYRLVDEPGYAPPESAFAVHCWNSLWREYQLNKYAAHGLHSAFERLKKRCLGRDNVRLADA